MFKKIWLIIFGVLLLNFSYAQEEKILNVYNWSGYFPDDLLQQFEKETGIHINYSTYDSNETLYAKLKANPDAGYDIVVPSTYFVDRMRREKMLEKLDKTKIVGFENLNPTLLNKSYDPFNNYSIPYLTSVTGIVYNDLYYQPGTITKWSDLWDKKFRDQLLMLDDVREVFSVALIVLGYSPNTTRPEQIHAAYVKLKRLLPNIKLFNTEAPKAILIDEDATVGMAWTGDAFLASQDNPHLHFVFPEDGFIVAQDSVVIPMNAPHEDNAYKFINFILRPENAARISENTGYISPNRYAYKYLPEKFRHSPILFPSAKIMERGIFQLDVGDAANLYEKYLEQLKLSA